jgi:hypothetical protein
MRWVNENAKRVKAGFDLYHDQEIKKKEVIKVTSATVTARKIEEETKVYQLRKFEEKQEAKRIHDDAVEAQKALIGELAETITTIRKVDGWSLPEGRDRYIYWLTVKTRVDLNESLNTEEEYFFAHYPNTADYRACSYLHENHGEIYTGGQI